METITELPEKFSIYKIEETGLIVTLCDGTNVFLPKSSDQIKSQRSYCYEQARDYFETAIILDTVYQRKGRLYICAATNCAFACELFLKCLAMQYGQFKQGHNLEKLYNHLIRLEPSIDASISSNPELTNFQVNLKQNADIFSVMRYMFEKSAIEVNIGFLLRFAKALNEICSSNLDI